MTRLEQLEEERRKLDAEAAAEWDREMARQRERERLLQEAEEEEKKRAEEAEAARLEQAVRQREADRQAWLALDKAQYEMMLDLYPNQMSVCRDCLTLLTFRDNPPYSDSDTVMLYCPSCNKVIPASWPENPFKIFETTSSALW